MLGVIIQDYLKQIIIMDDGYQYFKKSRKFLIVLVLNFDGWMKMTST